MVGDMRISKWGEFYWDLDMDEDKGYTGMFWNHDNWKFCNFHYNLHNLIAYNVLVVRDE